jgi:hypothetical protein
MLENAALRHQLGVLMQAGRRPPVTAADRYCVVAVVSGAPRIIDEHALDAIAELGASRGSRR